MSESFLDRYTKAEAVRDSGDGPRDSESSGDTGCFGFLRGGTRERVEMLELRKKTGRILAVGYHAIERVEYNPSDGIILHALGRSIRIKGRNLNADGSPHGQLFRGIVRHRVAWVREADASRLVVARDDESVVDAIEW